MSDNTKKVYLYIKKKEFKNAIELLLQIESRGKYVWTYDYLKGFCYSQIKDFSSSLHYYEKALNETSDKPLILNAMGNAYQNLYNFAESINCYDYAIELLDHKETVSLNFNLYKKDLLSELFNNLGVALNNYSSEKKTEYILWDSLVAHYNSIIVLEETFKIIADKKGQTVFFNNREFFKNQKDKIIKGLRFKTKNYTLFNVNLACQLFRLGEFQKSKKCITNCIKNINNSHKYWTLAKSTLLDILFDVENKKFYENNNLFFH